MMCSFLLHFFRYFFPQHDAEHDFQPDVIARYGVTVCFYSLLVFLTRLVYLGLILRRLDLLQQLPPYVSDLVAFILAPLLKIADIQYFFALSKKDGRK